MESDLPLSTEVSAAKLTDQRDPSRSPLPWGKIARWTVAILVLVFIALLTPLPFDGRLTSALGDLVHAPLFGSLAFVWLWVWQRLNPLDARHSRSIKSESVITPDENQPAAAHPGRRFLYRGLVVWVVLSLFGGMMELLQSTLSRSGSLHDAQANSLGIASAILLCAGIWFYRHQRHQLGVAFGTMAAFLLAFAWYPPYLVLTDVVAQRREFPLLGSFERSAEIKRWYFRHTDPQIVQEHATDGSASMRVDYQPADWAIATMVDLIHDWSAYKSVKVDVRLDDAPGQANVDLIVKIIDAPSLFQNDPERKRTVKLQPGETRSIEIRLDELGVSRRGHAFDPTQIEFFELGIAGATKPTRLWIDHLRLSE